MLCSYNINTYKTSDESCEKEFTHTKWERLRSSTDAKRTTYITTRLDTSKKRHFTLNADDCDKQIKYVQLQKMDKYYNTYHVIGINTNKPQEKSLYYTQKVFYSILASFTCQTHLEKQKLLFSRPFMPCKGYRILQKQSNDSLYGIYDH